MGSDFDRLFRYHRFSYENTDSCDFSGKSVFHGLLFLLHMDPKANNNQMTEEELRTIVDVSKENGVIESEEHEMINNLFDFGDAQAKEVMIPRPD